MFPTPAQIKEKLVKALDDNNEVNESEILHMVSILEKYPITRSTLEETRIGKMVNDLRKKIKNEKLAKRIKQLVRNWKKILDETAPVNGTKVQSPACNKLPSNAAVSPALTPEHGISSRLSPASFQSKPNTPTSSIRQSASPAFLSGKSAALSAKKSGSPALGPNQTSVNVQRVASPALAPNRPKTPLATSASGCVSPAVSPHAVSTFSERVSSPAYRQKGPFSGNGHVAPPEMGLRTVPTAGKGSLSNPGLGHVKLNQQVATPHGKEGTHKVLTHGIVKGKLNHSLTVSPIQSPGLRVTTPNAGSLDMCEQSRTTKQHRSKGNKAFNEKSNFGGRITPSSLHSDSSQDWMIEETGNGRQDSDGGSSCNSSRTNQSCHKRSKNHSTDLLLNSSNKNCEKEKIITKSVLSRKRAWEEPGGSPEACKKSKLESSSLSLNNHKSEKVVNGRVSSNKKRVSAVDNTYTDSARFQPVHKHISSPPSSHSLTEGVDGSSKSYMLRQQDSLESDGLSTLVCDKPSREKHKVKTTEQLIEELQKKNSSNVGNNIMTQLRSHQIDRNMPETEFPTGVKPRGKKGRRRTNDVISASVPSSDMMLSQAKNELVERFLKTSDPSSPVDEYSVSQNDLLHKPGKGNSAHHYGAEFDACNSQHSKNSFDGSFSAGCGNSRSSQNVKTPNPSSSSQSAGNDIDSVINEIYAKLPPIDYNIDWNAVGRHEVPERNVITGEAVTNLHNDQIPNINGQYDINGKWTTWKETLTLPSYEGEPLHILPYVDLY